jgi:hypothetical protein
VARSTGNNTTTRPRRSVTLEASGTGKTCATFCGGVVFLSNSPAGKWFDCGPKEGKNHLTGDDDDDDDSDSDSDSDSVNDSDSDNDAGGGQPDPRLSNAEAGAWNGVSICADVGSPVVVVVLLCGCFLRGGGSDGGGWVGGWMAGSGGGG